MENKTIAWTIIQLNNELNALEEKKCKIVSALKEAYENLSNKWTTIFNKVIDAPMALTYANINEGFNSEDYSPRLSATVEYMEEGKGVFGSDFSLHFSFTGGISINAGTMGSYSKADVAQVARAKAIAKIWENVDSLEAQLKAVDVTAIVNMEKERYSICDEISDIKVGIIAAKKVELNTSVFVEGATLILKEGKKDNLFKTNFKRYDSKTGLTAEVIKVARKKVTFRVSLINQNGRCISDEKTLYKEDVMHSLCTLTDAVWDLKAV